MPTAQRGSLRPLPWSRSDPPGGNHRSDRASRRRQGRAEAADPSLLTMAEVTALLAEPAGNRNNALGQML